MEKKIIAKVYKDGDEGMGFEMEKCTVNDHLNIIAGFVSSAIVRMYDAKIEAQTSTELLDSCIHQGIEDGLAKLKVKIIN